VSISGTEGATWNADRPFQILSFDGGGLKGLFPAAILAAIEEDLGSAIADHFDLIVGTSTGGLVALGLGAGLRPAEIVDFYTSRGPEIFGAGRWFGQLWRSKHSAERLRSALVEVFGDSRLGSSTKRLVIPSYSLDSNDVYVFKTPHHPRLRRDHKERMVDVAMATTAAPLFLPVFRLGNNRLIDGGVWANNPTLVAVAEAKSMLDVPLDAMRILSMGTTDDCVDLGDKLNRGGLIQWARPASSVLLRGQAIGSFHAAEHLVGAENVTRIDSPVPAGLFKLDRTNETRIRGLAEDVARTASPAIERFTTQIATPYVPMNKEASNG
jgi:patatin-like phospholipase/acyl hydrolase